MTKNIILLTLSMLSLSQAGNIIRMCQTHSYTITFYRLLFSFILLTPFFIKFLKPNIKKLNLSSVLQISLMGIIFSLHLFFWNYAVVETSVTNAALILSLNPLFITLGASFFFNEKISKLFPLTLTLGLSGMLITAWPEIQRYTPSSNGSTWAVISLFFFIIYFLLGKKLRTIFDNFFIMPLVYFSGSITSLLFIFTSDSAPLINLPRISWIHLIVLAIFPTILGHGLLINASKHFRASTISTSILIQPLLAGIGAYLAFNEKLTIYTTIGYVVIILAMLSFIFDNKIESIYKRLKQ